MKIFISIFAVSITVFFFFSTSVAYSWTLYLSATIHKSYMFLLCNSLLVFICLNSGSTVSLEQDYGRELAEKKQAEAEGYFPSGPTDISRAVDEVGDEKETGSLHVVQVREDRILIAADNDEKASETLFVEETRDDELEAVEDDYDMTLFVVEETRDDESEAAEDDMNLSVIEEIRDDDQQEKGGSVDMVSLEELNKRFEEFIRTTKRKIRAELLTIECY